MWIQWQDNHRERFHQFILIYLFSTAVKCWLVYNLFDFVNKHCTYEVVVIAYICYIVSNGCYWGNKHCCCCYDNWQLFVYAKLAVSFGAVIMQMYRAENMPRYKANHETNTNLPRISKVKCWETQTIPTTEGLFVMWCSCNNELKFYKIIHSLVLMYHYQMSVWQLSIG